MRKIFALTLLCLFQMAALPLAAQTIAATQRLVGYSEGDSISQQGLYFGQEDTYPVGALATPSLLENYIGCKVVGIRFAVSESIGKTNVFMYEVKDGVLGDTLVSQSIRRPSVGWNTVFFNGGNEYEITGEESFIFGFNYNETAEMVSASKGGLCLYEPTQQNSNAFLAMGNFGSGMGWYNVSSWGNLCVQLIVDVSSKPTKDVGLKNLLIGYYYKKPGEKISYYVEYVNKGLEKLTSCQLGYQIDEGEVTYLDCNTELAEDASESVDKVMTLPDDIAVGSHEFRFFVNQIDGETVSAGDAIVEKFVVYENGVKHQKHYVEQYNSQSSYYASMVNKGMNEVAEADENVCLVNIYEQESPLSLDESQYLFDLYAYTYPCFTVDRFYFFGESQIAFDVNDYVAVYPAIVTEGVRSIVYEADMNPAFATVDITPEYDKQTRQLTITVTGELTTDAQQIYDNLGLTLMLTEDKVKGSQLVYNSATGKVTTNNSYIHNNVLRQYVSAPKGDAIVTDGQTYTATYNVVLDDLWTAENMKVVALVGRLAEDVTADNVREMDITNCNSLSLRDVIESGIQSRMESDEDGAVQWFGIDGKRVSETDLHRGLYLRKQGKKTEKIIIN